ncbi:MAG: uL30 family ribosomal protein [Candidatus Micrarchaeaceae archaeon]
MNSKMENKLVAIVRVRGRVGVRQSISETLVRLNLKRVNNLAIVFGNKSNIGMIQKCNDFVTYGELEEKTLEAIFNKKEIKLTKEDMSDLKSGKKNLRNIIKKSITMHPPKHGYEGIKKGYSVGGALGYRGQDINTLIKRML